MLFRFPVWRHWGLEVVPCVSEVMCLSDMLPAVQFLISQSYNNWWKWTEGRNTVQKYFIGCQEFLKELKKWRIKHSTKKIFFLSLFVSIYLCIWEAELGSVLWYSRLNLYLWTQYLISVLLRDLSVPFSTQLPANLLAKQQKMTQILGLLSQIQTYPVPAIAVSHGGEPADGRFLGLSLLLSL